MAHTNAHPELFMAKSRGLHTAYWIDCFEGDDEYATVSIHLSSEPILIEDRLRSLEQAIADVRAMMAQETN